MSSSHPTPVAPGPPAWEETVDGVVELILPAVRMTMGALATTIVAIVLALGATCAGILILLDTAGAPSGRQMIIIIAGAVGIAASLALLAAFRVRRRHWRIRVSADGITVRSGRFAAEMPLSEVRLLRIRRHTDYARFVVVARTSRVSLLAGLGLAPTPGDTTAAYLNDLPPAAEARLRAAGLTVARSPRSPDLSDWRPAGPRGRASGRA